MNNLSIAELLILSSKAMTNEDCEQMLILKEELERRLKPIRKLYLIEDQDD